MFAILPPTVIGPGLGYAAPKQSPAGKVSSSSPSWGSHQKHKPTADIRRRVTIHRDSLDTPWGFRLQGGKDFNTPLSVKRVFSGSPAVGQLTRDDLILAINDEPVDDLFHADVLEKIKSAGNSIVLTIETSALDSGFGYASQHHFQPLQGPSQQQKLYNPEETRLQYEAYQTPSASSYDTSPTTYETSPTTYETSPTTYETPPTTYETSPTTYETSDPSLNRPTANVYNPKITSHQSRHRSAKRFQTAPPMPSGLSEPGWTPRPKSVPRYLPLSTPQPPLPSSQYRSPPAPADHPSVQYPAHRDFWKSDSTQAEGSGVPAWYGSLRSGRAVHSWEMRAAKAQIQSEQESSDAWKEPEQPQHTHPHQEQKQQVQPQQVQPEPGRTFKAEIKGLRLARPANPQTQSTPEWEDASEDRLYRSRDYTHSAPETPVADANVHAEVNNLTSYQDIQTSPSANYTQQAAESPSVKLQPSLLFGDRSGRAVQQPSAQSRVVIRAQPQTTKTTVTGVHTRQEVLVPAPQGAAQIVSPPTMVPVRQVVLVSQANPQLHPIIQQKAPEAVAYPSVQNIVKPSKEQQTIIKVSAQPAKLTYLPEIVERFNPVPDWPEPKAAAAGTQLTQVKHHSVPQTLGKLSKMPVERFNPVPDRSEQLTQVQVKHHSVPQTLGKLSKMPVECFNPVPDRSEQLTQMQVKHHSVPQTLGKLSKMPVERFNPVPDRKEQLTTTQVKHLDHESAKFPKAPVERFNPGPDRLSKA